MLGVTVRLNVEPGADGPIAPVKTKALLPHIPVNSQFYLVPGPSQTLVASCLSVLGLGCPLLPASLLTHLLPRGT